MWFILGLCMGAFGYWLIFRFKVGSFQSLGDKLIEKAEQEIQQRKVSLELELKEKYYNHQRKLDQLSHEAELKLAKDQERLTSKEASLETHLSRLDKKLADIEKKEGRLDAKLVALESENNKVALLQETLSSQLEQIAEMTTEQAKELLFLKTEQKIKQDLAHLTLRLKEKAKEEWDQEASRIISTAIQRMALSCSSDLLVTTVALPSEEIKGRIIGREGRNIRTLEQLTGVNFLLDDTPNAILISGFDPIRKHVAKTALSELIQDGRIHPTRIEESVEKAQKHIEKKIKEFGEHAAMRAGVLDLHPEIITLLGKLHFRSSLGQNILEHSIEVSYLMGLMAAELNLDVSLAKRIGLLHDMGKAVSHEKDGSHACVGYDLAKKYGEKEEVANGIGCHHDEMLPITIEASLCSSADSISAGRPGARAEAVEQYVKRLKKLESISGQFEGVVKAFALQAGREIRVMVEPDVIDDHQAINLARKLAERIEQELSYPGRIKVTVIREKRATEYAS